MAKSSRRRQDLPVERPRANTPLLFLMLLLVPLFGGYYNFFVLAWGAALLLLLGWTVRSAGTLRLPVGVEAWCLYGLCACHLLTVPFGVSWGMAFTGFLRTAVWALFFIYAASYSQEERRQILDAVAYEGAILSLLATAAFLYDSAAGVASRNGRIDGLFQYANAWALFQLICLILLLLKDRRRSIDWAAMAVLVCGIYLSGSRGIFLLFLFMALGWGGWSALREKKILPVALGALGVVAIGALAVVFSGGLVLDRLRAITLTSSSLNGRLLYDLDGLQMLLRHPLGVGRGGYLYIQPLEQTGVYTLRSIHNEYLQAALDGGVLAGVLLAGLMAALLFRKGAPLRERAVVFAIAAHCLIDFDLHFTAVVFLLLLCGSGGKCRQISLPRRPVLVAGTALALMFGYFAAAYYMDFTGRAKAAYTMFPADLSLAENYLQTFSTVEQAEPMADRIIQMSPLSMVAWDCKFGAAARRADLPAMVEAKYNYLRLNRYRGEVYEEFTALLENACAQGSQEELSRYLTVTENVIQQLEEVNRTTSPLAYRIVDKPQLGFSGEILERLHQRKERLQDP